MINKRRGSMLIQQLILIGLSGVVTLVAVQLIHRSLSFANGFQSQFNLGRSHTLLVRQFREDAHHATSISSSDSGELMMKILGGNEIAYRIQGLYLERKEIGIERERVTMERFHLGPHTVASFDANRQSVRLSLVRHAPDDREKLLPHKTMIVEVPWLPGDDLDATEPSPPGTESGVRNEE